MWNWLCALPRPFVRESNFEERAHFSSLHRRATPIPCHHEFIRGTGDSGRIKRELTSRQSRRFQCELRERPGLPFHNSEVNEYFEQRITLEAPGQLPTFETGRTFMGSNSTFDGGSS